MSNLQQKNTPKKGMAIIIVIFFAFSLMILLVSMSFQHRNLAQHNKMSLREQQAYFAGRSAMQHFLLKARLFPTELYDAVEFMQGKNPYMDFTEFPFRTDDNKPAFQELPAYSGVYKRIIPEENDKSGRVKYFYIPIKTKGSEPEALIRLASFYNKHYRYLAPGMAPSSLPGKYINPDNSAYKSHHPEKFLSYFIRDVTNDVVDAKEIQPGLKVEKATGLETEQSWDITRDGYPYTMTYRLKKVNLKAIKGLRRYNEEAIEVEYTGSVEDFQNQTATKDFTKIEKITRTGRHLD